jgi:PIN domain nuclease of toxin-antitoxin system
VSAWEAALKLETGKFGIDGGLDTFFRMIDDKGLIPHGIERDFLDLLPQMPPINCDHRMLIATALTGNLTLITAEKNIKKYCAVEVW